MILDMFDTPDGSRSGQLVIAWNEFKWISVKATFSVVAETDMRKADVFKPTKSSPFQRGKLTFASLRWCVHQRRASRGAVCGVTPRHRARRRLLAGLWHPQE